MFSFDISYLFTASRLKQKRNPPWQRQKRNPPCQWSKCDYYFEGAVYNSAHLKASVLLHNHSAKTEKMDMSVMAKSEKDMSIAKSDKDMSIAKSEKVKSDG